MDMLNYFMANNAAATDITVEYMNTIIKKL